MLEQKNKSRFSIIRTLLIFLLFGVYLQSVSGQTILRYGLAGSFDEMDDIHDALNPIANDLGETGFFDNFTVPTTTCPMSFDVDGYHYFDNAGLRFDNDGFIDCEFTIQFTFNIKDLGGAQSWVRLLNFTPANDNGIYVKLTDKPTNGTLEFWPNGLVGQTDFFNTVDLYQFVVTRTCSGTMNIYVNGQFFADYDDSSNPIYLPNTTDDVIVFFRDDPAVGNEASPGWVKNIVIADFAFTQTEVEEDWEEFCQVLQETDCAGTVDGTAVIDNCGKCLEMSDPDFNNTCADCAGVTGGSSIVDSCGVCLLPDDPTFNQSCADCAGVPNGASIIDECGDCLLPDDPDFNKACADCAGIPNGISVMDECGVCLMPGDTLFNATCRDCAGVLNGPSVLDECNVCLLPNDPEFNQSCTIKFYLPSAFSPNDDGINDAFEIYRSDDAFASIQSYSIYDLWGNRIYEARNFDFEDTNMFWDGSREGERLTSGIYVYVVEVVFQNGTVQTLSGDVAIIR